MSAIVALVGLMSGCGGEPAAKLDDYLEELEFDTPLDSSQEIELGTHVISIAARDRDKLNRKPPAHWVQVRFKLIAVVAPKDGAAVRAACDRHRGMLDDAILRIFRSSTIGELTDTRWATLKSRVIDSIRPILGGERVRQIVFLDYICEPI